VGVPRNLPPFSFIDYNTGGHRGLCRDLINLLAADMGVKPEFFGMTGQRLEESLYEGKIDLAIGLLAPAGKNERLSLVETGINVDRKIFVNKATVTVTCCKDLQGQTVALENGRDLTPLVSDSTGVTFIRADSQQKALALVNSGKANVYISESSLTTLYLIQKNDFKNIKEVGLPIESVPLTLAVMKDNADLLTEVSFSMGKILESRNHELIRRKWLGKEIQFSHWQEYLKYILAAFGLGIVVLLVFIFWNFMLKRRVQQVTGDFQRSEKKYRDLIESSPEMIHLISPDGRVRLANRLALQRLEYSENEMNSLRLKDLVEPDHRDRIEGFIDLLFREGVCNSEFNFQARDGTVTPVEVIATTISGLDGGEALACCFSRDMTRRKRLEEELVESERLAVMGQMAAGLAHEINNPLGIILANAEDVLANESNSENASEGLRTIERNAIRAGKIIEDLLSFTGPSPPDRAPIDILQLINESLRFLKQKLKQKRIKVNKPVEDQSVIFHCDENQIQQLLIPL